MQIINEVELDKMEIEFGENDYYINLKDLELNKNNIEIFNYQATLKFLLRVTTVWKKTNGERDQQKIGQPVKIMQFVK